MTAAQKLRTVGFNASLKTRGVLLTKQLTGGGQGASVNALVSVTDPEGGEFVVSDETRENAWLSMLNTDLATAGLSGLVVGDTLKSAAGVYYRIEKVIPRPGDICAVFKAETSKRA